MGWRTDAVTSYGRDRRVDAVINYGRGWRTGAVTSCGMGWGDGCRNQLWHGLEDGCRNPMLGDCALLPSPRGSLLCPNSKHWFTTSFLQPLPYLVTSQVPENCQLTSIFVVVGAQTVVRLLQTIQIKQDVSFIAANKVYTSTNKTTIVWIEMELFFFFLPGVDASHVYVGAWALGCFHSHN